MTREMQDGINSDAAGMDHSIALVAYYIDGHFAWTPGQIALFPNSVHVRIATRSATRDGHVIDREAGDATPAQAAAWARQRRADGYATPAVYCSIANQGGVIAAFNAIREPMPLWWLAHYDGLDVLPPGAIAKQYASPGPLDRSVVADFWPGVDGGGTVPVLDSTDLTNLGQAVLNAFIAFRVPGPDGAARNLWDSDYQTLSEVLGLSAAETAILTAVQGADADVKAGVTQILAALTAGPGGNVDINKFAAALAPMLPADATPAAIGQAVASAFEAHIAANGHTSSP